MSTIMEDTTNLEGSADDDISFCDDWDILQEEDFKSEEEEKLARIQLTEIEEAMMKQYFASAEAKNEEKEMMEELERIETEQKEVELQAMPHIIQEDQKKIKPVVQEVTSTQSSKRTPSPPKKKRMKPNKTCDIGSSPALRKTSKLQKTEDKILQKTIQSPTKKITKSPHLPPAKKNTLPKKSPAKKKIPTLTPCPDLKLQEKNLEPGCNPNKSKDGNGTR